MLQSLLHLLHFKRIKLLKHFLEFTAAIIEMLFPLGGFGI